MQWPSTCNCHTWCQYRKENFAKKKKFLLQFESILNSENLVHILTDCFLFVCLFICFQPPYVCPFQTADYTIEVQENGTNETFTQGPVRYSPATMREPVSLRVPAPLVVNREYVLTVTASTIAGSSSFISNFSES